MSVIQAAKNGIFKEQKLVLANSKLADSPYRTPSHVCEAASFVSQRFTGGGNFVELLNTSTPVWTSFLQSWRSFQLSGDWPLLPIVRPRTTSLALLSVAMAW